MRSSSFGCSHFPFWFSFDVSLSVLWCRVPFGMYGSFQTVSEVRTMEKQIIHLSKFYNLVLSSFDLRKDGGVEWSSHQVRASIAPFHGPISNVRQMVIRTETTLEVDRASGRRSRHSSQGSSRMGASGCSNNTSMDQNYCHSYKVEETPRHIFAQLHLRHADKRRWTRIQEDGQTASLRRKRAFHDANDFHYFRTELATKRWPSPARRVWVPWNWMSMLWSARWNKKWNLRRRSSKSSQLISEECLLDSVTFTLLPNYSESDK